MNNQLAVIIAGRGQLRLAEPALQHQGEVFGGNDETDSAAREPGDHDADQSSMAIDHRTAAIAMIYRPPSICTRVNCPASSRRRLEIDPLPTVIAGLP